MTGFQVFLCVLAGIIAFFILILSIPLKVSIGYDDKIRLSIKYLFIKINVLPLGPKKAKEKPPKEKKPKEEKPKEEKPKEKKPNPILEMVKANGYDGMMLVITNLGKILGSYGGKIFKSITFDRIDLHISVGTGDSAATALKYGKTCQQVYPVMGFICSNNLVRKYDIMVEPDFLANSTQGEFFCDMNICLRKIINATLSMVIKLIFGVVVKFVKGGTSKPKEAQNNINTQTKPQS